MSHQNRILVIDNFDSFTFNLVHLIEQLGMPYEVHRNNESFDGDLSTYSHLLIGPGPGLPSESGNLMELIEKWSQEKPLLGICLGMQAILEREGGQIENLNPVYHGAQEAVIVIQESEILKNIPSMFIAGRYHSWGYYSDQVPAVYQIVAKDNNELVMTVAHNSRPWFGIQFHPESIMTEHGFIMLKNFSEIV